MKKVSSLLLPWAAGKFVSSRRVIIRQHRSTNCEPVHNRICVFAHFDRWRRIDPYVLHYLRHLREAGCDILMVSSCNSLPEEDLKIALRYCFKIVTRLNCGYDFASFRTGLDLVWHEIGSRYQEVILANDSVYGPFCSLKPIFARMEDIDVWGMTDSYQRDYHLQSYFISMSAKVFEAPIVQNFWKRVRFHHNKEEVVSKFEIGLSRVIRRSHFSMAACYPYTDLQRAAIFEWMRLAREAETEPLGARPDDWSIGQVINSLTAEDLRERAKQALSHSCNPTHEFWDILSGKFDFPFLKVELIRKNPCHLPNLLQVRDLLSSEAGFDPDWIEAHRRRTG